MSLGACISAGRVKVKESVQSKGIDACTENVNVFSSPLVKLDYWKEKDRISPGIVMVAARSKPESISDSASES